jgi:hypothetical protein
MADTPSPKPSVSSAPIPTVYIPPVGARPSATPTPSANTPPAPVNSTPTTLGTNPTGKPVINPAGPVNAGLTYKDLIPVYDQTTKSWTTAYIDPTTSGEKWAAIVGDHNSPTGYSVSTDQVATRLQTMNDLIQQYGTLSRAKKALAEQGLYQQAGIGGKTAQLSVASNLEDKAFDTVLDLSIGAISRTNWNNLTTGNGNVDNLATYISGRPNYAGTKNTLTESFTSKDAAWTDIDSFMRSVAGRGATLAEYQDYYNNLHQYEQQHPIKATVTRDALGMETNRIQTEGPSAEDKKAILVASAYKSLQALGKDPSAISKVGGDVAIAIQKLNQQAAAMGVSDIYDPTKSFNGALNSILPGGTVDSEMQKITALAKANPKYKGYGSLFDAGFTLQDIAKPGQELANKLLETSTPVQVNDPLMQKYLLGGANGTQMNNDDFTKFIKSDPVYGAQWSKTQNAREEAAGYLMQIGKMMGFIG